MHVARLSTFLATLMLVAACSQHEEPAVEVADVDIAAQLEAIYAEYNEDVLKQSPILATFRGDSRYNDQWGTDTLTDEYLEMDLAMQRNYFDRVTAIDPGSLSGQDRLIYDADPAAVPAEDRKHRRKSAAHD